MELEARLDAERSVTAGLKKQARPNPNPNPNPKPKPNPNPNPNPNPSDRSSVLAPAAEGLLNQIVGSINALPSPGRLQQS